MKTIKQLKLAAAVAAGLALVGCGSDSDDNSGVPFERSLSMAANANQSVVDLTAIADQTCFDAGECSASGYTFPQDATFVPGTDGENITTVLQAIINGAGENEVIVLPKGTFKVDASVQISASQNGLTLVGYGIDQTKLDFIDAPQDDGIKVLAANNIELRDFAVYEAAKNGIKVDQATGVLFNHVATIWENPLTPGVEGTGLNGIYGLYPVGSEDVVMEYSYSKGSSDAGIYVGQTSNIVVRHSVAEHNVAGIEIENSSNADVYGNVAFDNTGGLLVFDLDGLDKPFGSNIRIFDNDAYDNNLANAGSGFVGYVPQGTGALILASDGVEMFNNRFENNNGQAIALTSYFLLFENPDLYSDTTVEGNFVSTMMEGWSPVINNIYIHDNTYKNNSTDPDLDVETSLLAEVSFGYQYGQNFTGQAVTHPAVIYDGVGELLANTGMFDELKAPLSAGLGIDPYTFGDTICIENSVNENDNGNTLNVGYVFGTNPVEVHPTAMTPLNFVESVEGSGEYDTPNPTLRVEEIGSEGQTLMVCSSSPARLAASTATVNGVTYGCGTGGDDNGTGSCNL